MNANKLPGEYSQTIMMVLYGVETLNCDFLYRFISSCLGDGFIVGMLAAPVGERAIQDLYEIHL